AYGRTPAADSVLMRYAMIGTYPMSALGPLDYRYALDAAMSALAGAGAPAIRCNIPELAGEVRQRAPRRAETGAAAGALWVEPLGREHRLSRPGRPPALRGASALLRRRAARGALDRRPADRQEGLRRMKTAERSLSLIGRQLHRTMDNGQQTIDTVVAQLDAW